MKINKDLASSLHRLAKKGKDRKELKSIKEKFYPGIKLYNLRGQVIGSLGQGESVDYNELLLKKRQVKNNGVVAYCYNFNRDGRNNLFFD
ncbi:hypothetical protein ES705_49369 [subsurface metagenome]